MREAKTRTSWIEPDSGYESAVLDLARAVLNDETLTGRIAAFVTWITPDAIANSLGAKLVQLTMPGVPDIYQGGELAASSLVDPDNRRPVDFARRRVMLAALDETSEQDGRGAYRAAPGTGARPASERSRPRQDSLDAGKLLVCSRAVRLRREHPAWFAGGYKPLSAGGPAREHAVAFSRSGQCVTVATRLPAGLRRKGVWQDTALRLPPGRWQDLLTGALHDGGEVRARPS